jgi:hypothetical protein
VKTLQVLALTAVAFLAPAKSILLTVAALTMVDLCLGILASRRRGVKLNSKGLKHSVIKVAVYEVAVLLAYVVQTQLTGPELPLLNMLTTLIGLTELKSCLENLDIVYGEPFFKHIIARLSKMADSEGKDDGQS